MNSQHCPVLQTTLMDVLAGRKTGGEIEGDIRVNVRDPGLKPSIFPDTCCSHV